jgi:hypothetical protein
VELLELLDPSWNRNPSEMTKACTDKDPSETMDMLSEGKRKCNDEMVCPIDEENLSSNDVSYEFPWNPL